MSEDKSKLQLIGEIIQADNKNLELIEELNKKEDEIERLNNIIKEVGEEVRIYEVQSKDGITNELDNYVFVQRLKNVLNKGE